MKSASFIFDRRLYELLQEEGRARFTVSELCDAYAQRLDGTTFCIGDVRRYVYEHVRRMLHMGWVDLVGDRRSLGQIYQMQSIPAHLKLELVDNGFQSSLNPVCPPEQETSVLNAETAQTQSEVDTDRQLEMLHKEVRLDFLASLGETERFKLLLEAMPYLSGQVEGEYLEARDRSSRLLGHLRAIEKTLKLLAAKQ